MNGVPRRVAVVGGGLSGLVAARTVQQAGARPTVFEAADRLGGKVFTSELGGEPFDVGADAFLFRMPEFTDLCEELGLADELIAPSTGQVWLWFEDGLRRLPSGTVLGLPADPDSLESSGVLSPIGLADARSEAALGPPSLGPDDDPPLRPFVVERFGVEIADRLVDPLLSGVYAGDTDRLGLRSATPVIAALADEAVRHQTSMASVLAKRRVAAAQDGRPVFKTVRGGLRRVIDRLAEDLPDVRTHATVSAIERDGSGWLVAGERYDGVVLATPAPVSAQLLQRHHPEAASLLDEVRYASAVVVAMAYPPTVRLPDGSGMLVPRDHGRFVKAVTWSSRKWPHLAERGHVLLRCSAGRVGDTRHLGMSDAEIVASVRDDLAASMGLHTDPVDVVVTRWGHALPQFDTGHRARMLLVRQLASEVGVALAGAAHEGVGLPACVASGQRAAAEVLGEG